MLQQWQGPKPKARPMAVLQSDLKLLWGRSGNRCALCRCELSFDPEHASSALPLGEQAHIVAKVHDGPRGNSILTSEERDSYDNLILVCPTDHARIDKAIEDYPIEKLHLLKAKHELWVRSQLAREVQPGIAEQVYASLLDSFVENCGPSYWSQWAKPCDRG